MSFASSSRKVQAKAKAGAVRVAIGAVRAKERTKKAGRNTKAFVSDGCSGVPDWNIFECCKEHDFAYERGEPRPVADSDFHHCIKCRMGRAVLGAVYYVGVRAFGWNAYYVGRRRGWAANPVCPWNWFRS